MARSWIENKGYGWALEVEDDDDDEDTPLVQELEIDVADICKKARWALRPPPDGVGELADFWGPLAVMLSYSALVVWGQLAALSWVLSIWIFGSAAVYAIARLLGSDVSYAHTLASLGYCMLPLVACRALMLLALGNAGALSLVARGGAICWATYGASRWLQTRELAHKELLIFWPILLHNFYLVSLSTGV